MQRHKPWCRLHTNIPKYNIYFDMANGPLLKIHPSGDMIVALADLRAGEVVALEGQTFQLNSACPTLST
ncbi:MAG: hypothetical protein V4714_16720 [Bacteroidota bacterium]